MANENTVLGGFDMISEMISGKSGGDSTNIDVNDSIPFIDPEDLMDHSDDGEGEDTTTEPTEDSSDEPVDDVTDTEDTGDDGDGEPPTADEPPAKPVGTDVDFKSDPEVEQMVSQLLQERLGESLGYEFGDDEKFESVQQVVDYLEGLVQEASAPDYASDEVKKIDEFIREGGDLRKYYDTVYGSGLNLENADISNESDQKRIVREYLKSQGLKEEIINNRVTRYETNGVLEEEAIEALDLLKENVVKNEQKLLDDQKEHSKVIKERQREFVTSVEETIDKMTEIFGTKLTAKEKMELKPYILRPTPDGTTKYQKDYTAKDKYIHNLITSAYLTMKGDALVERAKKQATSDTYKNIQKKLQDKKGNRISSGSTGQNTSSRNLDLSKLSSSILRK